MKKIFGRFFFPKESNNFQAKSISIDFLSLYLIVAFFLSIGLKNLAFSKNVLGYATDINVQKLLEDTNKERVDYHLTSLTYNKKLALAAQKKANNMFLENYWAHYSPEGESPWDFIIATGYRYEYAGENLAKNFLFSQDVVNAWMKSPSHRENMLRPQYSQVGFAVKDGILNGEKTTLVVQMFAKPMVKNSQPIAKKISQQKPKPLPVIENKTTKNVLAGRTQSLPLIPRIFNLNLIFISFLVIAFLIDFYYAVEKNLFRLTGKRLAHIMFLLFIFVGFLILKIGVIS